MVSVTAPPVAGLLANTLNDVPLTSPKWKIGDVEFPGLELSLALHSYVFCDVYTAAPESVTISDATPEKVSVPKTE